MIFENITYNPLLLLNVGRIEMYANWNFPKLRSPFLRIYYVERGEAEITMNGEVHRLTPGHLYFIPPFTEHSDHCDSSFVHYYLHVMDQTIQGRNIYENNVFPFEIEAKDSDVELIKRLCELYPNGKLQQVTPSAYDNQEMIVKSMNTFNQQNHQRQYESQGMMMMLIARFYTGAKPKEVTEDDRLIKVKQYIQENLACSLQLDDLASEAAMCKDSLIRRFRKELGITPVEYILQKRIEKAQMMLIFQPVSIKEVAIRLGFGNQSYFASQFKRVIGMSPLEYRKRNQDSPSAMPNKEKE